jgi:hypothetical protein
VLSQFSNARRSLCRIRQQSESTVEQESIVHARLHEDRVKIPHVDIHDKMVPRLSLPVRYTTVILDADDYDAWLSCEEVPLVPFPADRMTLGW